VKRKGKRSSGARKDGQGVHESEQASAVDADDIQGELFLVLVFLETILLANLFPCSDVTQLAFKEQRVRLALQRQMALFVFMGIQYKRMGDIILNVRQEAREDECGGKLSRAILRWWVRCKQGAICDSSIEVMKRMIKFTRHRMLQHALLTAMRKLRVRIATAQNHFRWLMKRRVARLKAMELYVLRWERRLRHDASEIGSIAGLRFPMISLIEIRKREETKKILENQALMKGEVYVDKKKALPSKLRKYQCFASSIYADVSALYSRSCLLIVPAAALAFAPVPAPVQPGGSRPLSGRRLYLPPNRKNSAWRF
jgi:hypothetical protein